MGITTRRPKFHLTPPKGWMNDPCAPYYDEKTGLYHIWYQYVPNHTEWNAEIGWGHSWTSDFRSWHTDETPGLMPTEAYDELGVFTGNLDVRTIGSDKLVAMYTCINEKAKKQEQEGYQWGQERLALASSTDRGKSWTKDPKNPIPLYPPENVTGWRDPYIFPSPSLDSLTSSKQARHYCIISGGLHGVGPTIFLYALPATEALHEEWEYLGPLVRPALSPETPKSAWGGDRGGNWECAGLFTMPGGGKHGGNEWSWLIIGSDGPHVFSLPGEKQHPPPGEVPKMPMPQLWLAGPFSSAPAPPAGKGNVGYHLGKDGVEMDVRISGVLDWGTAYATQSFPSGDGRRLMIAWLVDNDLSPAGRAKQTYAGAFTHPRELFVHTVEGVVGALQSSLDELSSFEVTESPSGGHTLRTMGIRPAREVLEGRGAPIDFGEGMKASDSWEAHLTAPVQGADEVGLEIVFADGHTAEIVFLPSEETIVVRRDKSIPDAEREFINVNPELGKHTLFLSTSGEWESLDLTVLWDGTVLEVFANDRFALSTHLYGGACSARPLRRGGGSAEGETVEGWYY